MLVQLILELNEIVGKYGVGCIDYVENCFVGIKLCEVYECLVVMILIKVYKEFEDLILVKEVVYFKLVIEKKLIEVIYEGLWFFLLINLLFVFLKDIQ